MTRQHRGRKGHEINLASGVMFSPAQEHERLKKARSQMARELIIEVAPKLGLRVKYIKRPSLVSEFQFFREADGLTGEMIARRSLVQDEIDRVGGRTAAGRLLESVCIDLGMEFDWNEFPNQPEPQERMRVDNVGSPPDVAPRIQSGPPVAAPAPEPEKSQLPFNPQMTIRELKEWSDVHGKPVPSDITRKGDVIEWMIREHSN
jgi:hypothetical protein